MKSFIIFLHCFLLFSAADAQKAMTFNEAKEFGIRTTYLDSIYQSGAHSDSTLAVFQFQQNEFIAAYQQMLQDLGVYLKKHNFYWKKSTKGFNRIYFNKNGRIDYFLYSFRPEQLTAEQERTFGLLLSKFIAKYKFPLKAEEDFSQCSPVIYSPTTP